MMYGRYRPDQIARMMIELDRRQSAGELSNEASTLYNQAKVWLLLGRMDRSDKPSLKWFFIALAICIPVTLALAFLAVGVA